MNEYNHHRIIERFALDNNLGPSEKDIFVKASDFTDSIWAKSDYFFYRNYYTINAENNTLRLDRVDSNGYIISNRSTQNIKKTGEKLLNGKYSLDGDWSHWTDEKEFFSAVNGRCKSAHLKVLDTGNQSDNVAFLHAMGAIDETEDYSRDEFVKHFAKCFTEYLFLENEEDALFMLGIAFHGIMDSFTPSHMNFQKYLKQDMGLHAQGDVIPIMGKFNEKGQLLDGVFSAKEDVLFDPGQYTKESPVNQTFIRENKFYDGDGSLNPIEWRMFRIFLYISDIQTRYDRGNWKNLNVEQLFNTFNNYRQKEINRILGNKEEYRYSPKSYAYSEAALTVMREIYQLLSKSRNNINSYESFKTEKDIIIPQAVNIWEDIYEGRKCIKYIFNNCEIVNVSMKELRKEHIGLSLYSEDEEMRKYKATYFMTDFLTDTD